MAEFIIADTHFGHANVIDFEKRPYESIEEMDAKLIEAWNDVVGKTDTVYHLGDFSFGGRDEWARTLDALKGNIVLIKGNHDKTRIINHMLRDGLLAEVHTLGTVIKRDGLFLNLSHYPMMIGERHRQFSVHGHIHAESMGTSYHVNVGVDNYDAKYLTRNKPFGTPIALDVLIEELHEMESDKEINDI